MAEIINFPKQEEKKYLTHERLLNLIIFVLMDQLVTSYDASQQSNDQEKMAYHDALLSMREDARHICAIEDWVTTHQERVQDSTDVISKQYYDMVLDGIIIEYYYSFKGMDMDSYALDCEKKYSKWN